MPEVKHEKSFETFAQLSDAFKAEGCDELLIKFLSKNQDNEKNQIYLGKSLTLAQYFPGELELRSASTSERNGSSGNNSAIVALKMDFAWLWPREKPSLAPRASIIEYAQYPEVRMSGFLTQSAHSPEALRRDAQSEYGQRMLVLGVAQRKVFGAVVTEASEPSLVRELATLPEWPLQKMLRYHKLNSLAHEIDSDALFGDLRKIAKVIHKPQILRAVGEPVEFISGGNQAGGWTLEALLGVARNSKSGPDKFGFEIKAVGGSRTSLITTEPDFGYKAENGVSAYLERFGREARAGEGKRVFTGVHRCNRPNLQSGAHLTIENWDFEANEPNGRGQPSVLLIETATDSVISGWSFAKIGASWTKKHAGAIYVQTEKVVGKSGDVVGYRFGPQSYLGLGTSALRFLTQLGAGNVILDPGDSKALGSPAHSRTQWRIEGSFATLLFNRLSPLYESLHVAQL
jgi:hypothetical protein